MSEPTGSAVHPAPDGASAHGDADHPMGTLRGYLTGFVLSVILTAIPFWLVTLMIQVRQRGLIADNQRRLMCLSMFWHFLDVVWIGVFTFVYLMGAMR